jgi:antitoxin ParD1/3/4
MPNTAKHIVSLAPEDDAFVEAQLRSGAYRSASEVVGAGLRALQEQNATFEDWLREEVGPTFDAMQADPPRGLSVKTAFDAVRSRHAERLKAGR